jgi:hypothetical protein
MRRYQEATESGDYQEYLRAQKTAPTTIGDLIREKLDVSSLPRVAGGVPFKRAADPAVEVAGDDPTAEVAADEPAAEAAAQPEPTPEPMPEPTPEPTPAPEAMAPSVEEPAEAAESVEEKPAE